MAEELALVGVGDFAVVGQFVDLGRVVQERADEQLVVIEPRVERRDGEHEFHQADDMLEQPALVGMMILHAGRGGR